MTWMNRLSPKEACYAIIIIIVFWYIFCTKVEVETISGWGKDGMVYTQIAGMASLFVLGGLTVVASS